MSHGPMPAAVYWRRRLMIVAVLIALVWLAVRVVSGGEDEQAPQSTPTPAAKPTPTPVPTEGTFDVALTADQRDCDPEQVRMTPTVPSGQQTRGTVEIDLVVASTETTSCTLQPDDAELIAVISANDTPVWDSTLCRTALLTEPVQLSAGWSPLVTTTWSGRGSGSACTSKAAWAGPGKYRVQIGTLGGEPGEATFSLAARPEKKAEPQPSPSPEPTASEKKND